MSASKVVGAFLIILTRVSPHSAIVCYHDKACEPGLNSKAGAKVLEGPLEPGGKVNNQLDGKLKAKSEAEMRAAVDKIKREGVGPYDVLGNNCEHLATRIRYGIPQSLQADAVLSTQPIFNNEMSENMGASFFPSINK